jgi:hypothetical protein
MKTGSMSDKPFQTARHFASFGVTFIELLVFVFCLGFGACFAAFILGRFFRNLQSPWLQLVIVLSLIAVGYILAAGLLYLLLRLLPWLLRRERPAAPPSGGQGKDEDRKC